MNNKGKYAGVILAAGSGYRIQPLSFSCPKPMLQICNKPIIQYQIECMVGLGIMEIYIVCRNLKGELHTYFQDGKDMGIKIQYVEQDKPHGIAHALSKVERFITKPFLLFLGDILFITKDMKKILGLFENRQACGILAVKEENHPDYIKRNYAVFLHESGMVQRVVEKPRYVVNNLKGCGIYFFDLPIFDAIRRTPRTAMRDEYEITSAIQILIDDGYPVYPADVIEWDMNITFVDDLIVSNFKMLGLLDKDNVIGRNVNMHPETKIIRSIVGHEVIIEHPITIQESVIMQGTKIVSQNNITRSFIMNDFNYTFSEKVSYENSNAI